MLLIPAATPAVDSVVAEVRIVVTESKHARRWTIADSSHRIEQQGSGSAELTIRLDQGGRIVCSAEPGKWVKVVLTLPRGGRIETESTCVHAVSARGRVSLNGVAPQPANAPDTAGLRRE